MFATIGHFLPSVLYNGCLYTLRILVIFQKPHTQEDLWDTSRPNQRPWSKAPPQQVRKTFPSKSKGPALRY